MLILGIGTWLVASKESQRGKTIISARTELIVYSDLPADILNGLAQAYGQEHNVQITVLPSTEKQLLTRLQLAQSEQRGDVIITNQRILKGGVEKGTLLPIMGGISNYVKPTFTDGSTWIGVWVNPIILVESSSFFDQNGKYMITWHALSSKGPWNVVVPDFGAIPEMQHMIYDLGASWGQEETLNMFRDLSRHAKQYMKHSSMPVRMVAIGNTELGIGYYSDAMQYKRHNYPIQLIYPRDGSPYKLYGAGVLEGSRNEEESKLFISWLLSNEAKKVLEDHGIYYMSTGKDVIYVDSTGASVQLLNESNDLSEAEQKDMLDIWIKQVRFRKGQHE